ncbi:MAG: MoxR family ATPase [Thermoproteota archaeon]|jgi:nitric oxide reductase NorQ protein|nr:MoxR family ATPase [Thermoproteota archaeon]
MEEQGKSELDENVPEYLDWSNAFEILEKAHKQGIFVLVIGPKGTGKTTLVREFAKKQSMKLESINFSLRTRESHLVGSKSLTEGNIEFDEGILIKSMKEGNMLYLDEINAAEADVLLRLDEALDDRRQVVLKESGGEIVTAEKSWFVIATINPLNHVGTKELPPQLLSRFPIRLRMDYPPEEKELEIVKKHVPEVDNGSLERGIKLANTLRQAASVEELYYSPSLRETIAYAKLIDGDMSPKKAAEIVFGNVYAQWGNIELQKVNDIIASMYEG